MNNDQVKKIKRYVKDDRPNKLRSYVRKHKLNLTDVKLKHGRNLLHHCCKYGSGTILKYRYLIMDNVSGFALDDQKNTPLHIALKRALNSEQNQDYSTTTDCYTDFVLPLIEAFPSSIGETNSSGESCRNLLHQLVRCREKKQSTCSSSTSSDPDSDSNHGYDDDVRWRDRLAAECQDEYYSSTGRFEQDFQDYNTQEETYDDWAERIRSEYHAKKRSRSQAYFTKNSSKKSKTDHKPRTQAGPENLEDIRSKMREKFDKKSTEDDSLRIFKRRMKYEKKYKETLQATDKAELCMEDIPWPNLDSGDKDDIAVLFNGIEKDSADFKKYLRDQQIRWHPDKFAQRFGDRLKPEEKDPIIERVTKLSQSLNKMSS